MLKRMGRVVALFGLCSLASAQSSVGDLASRAGVDWLLGNWQAVTDNGDTVSLTFKADLDNHIVWVHHKDSRSESKGIVMMEPTSGKVKYYAANNLGGSGNGVWSAEDHKAILKYEHTAAEGRIFRIGITFAKLDSDQMEVKIYELSESGELASEPRLATKFNRKK